MRYLFLFTFLIIGLSGFSQTITAPSPLSIEANATNVDAGDFVITWPSAPANILVSVSLDYHLGATLSFPTNTGLTLNTGYTNWTGVPSIVFYGSLTSINTALAAMTVSMGSVKTAIRINLEILTYDANYKYNPTNKHFYKYVSSAAVTYADAKTGASSNTYLGKTGYLVTITSQSEQDFINNNITGNNLWIATTDVVTDGTWVIDAGPELGTVLKTQNGPTAGNIADQYNNWCSGEPNGSGHTEDYAVAKWNGGTCWNDLPNSYSAVQGYVVEISADFPSGSGYNGVYTGFVVHNNEKAFTKNSTTGLVSSTISNLSNLDGGIQINDGHTITLRSGHTINSNRIDLVGSGKIIFTNATTKWTPSMSSSTNTFIHSPSTNSNPSFWSSSSNFNNDGFYTNAPFPTTITNYHFTPWLNSPQGWSALTNNASQFLILNYNVPAYITGIVTQGRTTDIAQYVSNVNVDVSIDGNTWKRVLTGVNLNTNVTEAVATYFPQVEYAKFVKVMPTSSGWSGHITMRMGLIVKSNNIISDGLALQLDAGNLASYKGSGTVWKDLSKNSIDATLYNVTYNAKESHFEFNGTNSYVDFTANIGSPSVITVEMWVKTLAFGGMYFGFNVYDAWTTSSNLGFNTSASDQYGIPSSQVTTLGILNKWKHLVFVMNQGTTIGNKIYVNGVNQILSLSSGASRSGASFNSGNGRISSWSYDFSYLMKMNLGVFRVYKRELTQQEILDNFNTEKSRFGL
jgi:F5/8 type C domain/Lectin C-type domain